MVLATFDGPKETQSAGRIEETPWLATMRFGSGKTMYIGASETWRLRQYKESYHEMFWLNLARFATSGSQNREKFGRWVAAPKAMTGIIPVEIQIKEAVAMKGEGDGEAEKLVPGELPAPRRSVPPKIYVRKQGEDKDIGVFDLRPKASDGPWLGWFEGKVTIKKEGDYVLINKIFAPSHKQPLTTEVLEHRLRIDEAKLEDANVREDFDALRDLATDADAIPRRQARRKTTSNMYRRAPARARAEGRARALARARAPGRRRRRRRRRRRPLPPPPQLPPPGHERRRRPGRHRRRLGRRRQAPGVPHRLERTAVPVRPGGSHHDVPRNMDHGHHQPDPGRRRAAHGADPALDRPDQPGCTPGRSGRTSTWTTRSSSWEPFRCWASNG